MPRFYVNLDSPTLQHSLTQGVPVVLPEEIFHHWIRVLRAQVGDTASVFNGQGGAYSVTLSQVNKTTASVMVTALHSSDNSNRIRTHIGLVMSKGDRMDYAVQKATELGVSSIQLLESERCEARFKYQRDDKKINHWQGVIIAACEQCGLNIPPALYPPLALTAWVDNVHATITIASEQSSQSTVNGLALVLTPTAIQPLRLNATALAAITDIYLLIGPEGGLSDAEIRYAQTQQFKAWQIGNRVLRTETAPVVALSYLLALSDLLVPSK